MNHRSKNLLTMIQAIVRRTLVPKNATFTVGFEGRLTAIGANLDLLTKRKWVGAKVRELVESQLSYFQDLIGNRIQLSGDDDIILKPTAAEVIGLAVHELATNAGKYGCLHNDTGQLEIEWTIASEDSDQFVLRWTESGGPPVALPARTGFGSIVITRNPEMALGAKVSVDYIDSGLVWEMKAPIERIALPTS
jgi:two-component sensor histidine kinase